MRSIQRTFLAAAAGASILLGASVAGAQDFEVTAKRDAAVDRAMARAIVHLDTRTGRITIYAGQLGRYFSIVAADGRVLAERISETELAANHPDVAIVVDHGMATQMADL